MTRNLSYDVVVGIDFGSSGTGIAYSFMDENDKIILNIGKTKTDNKVPSEIIIDDDNNIKEFGYECKEYLQSAEDFNKMHYFKDIKMELYHNKTEITSFNSNKIFPLEFVIEKVLEKCKQLCIDSFKDKGYKFDENRIKWVVTVPAIWGNFQKSIMIKACENVGFINNNDDESLFFALEPEAASIFCLRDGNINKDLIKTGKYYIICDLGGGTGDIVTHLVGSNDTIEEIIQSDGDIYGSNEIDKKIFNDIIYKIFGFKDYKSLYQEYMNKNINERENVIFGDWESLANKIKLYKEGATLEKVKEKVNFPIPCGIFKDLFEDEEEDLDDLIDRYNDEIYDKDLQLNIASKRKWTIDFPYKIIYNYISEQSNEICKKIRNILSKTKEKIDTIIFAGGYCSNEILISLIKEGLNETINHFLIPSKPFVAVMAGAVLFGLNPYIITVRIAKYTIGVEVREEWNEVIHEGRNKYKIWCEDEKKWYCDNCFNKVIEINQKLKLGQVITKNYTMAGSRSCYLTFYQTSLKPEPKSVFEYGVEKMGELYLDTKNDFPIGERDIEVSIKFGGTFIDVKAIHIKSQKYINGTIKFNK